METIRCPICGTPNPDSLERCKACNQLLRQSTSELDGGGELISSGQTPTKKKTSELEQVLPAWLRHARKSEDQEEASPDSEEKQTEGTGEETPVLPDFSDEEPEEEKKIEAADPLDWLAGLESDDDDEEEVADWLVNLQGDLAPEDEPEAEEPPPVGTPATEESITANIPPSTADEDDETIKTGELPGWVSDLQGDAGDEIESMPDLLEEEEVTLIQDAAEEGELPDWLARLSEEADSSPAADEASTPELASAPMADAEPLADDSKDDLPDWMGELQAVGEVTVEGMPPITEETIEEASVEDEETPLVTEDDLPGWLSNEDETPSAHESAEEVQPTEATDELPDWMGNLENIEDDSAKTASAALIDESLPDWLSEETESPLAVESADKVQPAESTGDKLPDWMANLQAPEDTAPVVESSGEVQSAGSPEEELPDWMADLQVPVDEASIEEDTEDIPSIDSEDAFDKASAPVTVEEESSAPIEDDLPGWLGSIPAEDFSGQDLETEDASPQTDSQKELASSQASETSGTGAIAADDTPDWLDRIEKPETGPLEEIKPSSTEDETPDWLSSLPVDELGSEEESSSEAEPTAAISSSPAFVDDDSLLDAGEGDDADEIFGIEMPDWLSSLTPSDLDNVAEEEPRTAKADMPEDLSDAELPSWVQAMRPVASVVSDSSKSRASEEHVVASSGPLAGLSGILPVGPGMGPKNKPRAHALKLRVNESQQSSAAILEKLLASEAEPAATRDVEKAASIPLLRWAITLLLFLTIGFSLFTQTMMTPSPNIAVPEVGDAIEAVNQLSGEGSALLIFDYEAALSAEMQAAAAPLADHILLRGENIALLSTSPMGPALAEQFLRETQSRHNYQPGTNYVNLGYLPGGASGMLNFVSSPHNAITAQMNGISVWTLPPLADISELTDFSLVLVLTDDVERGRAWIEQASATLNDASIPLLMAVSAQAEPIIYPYYASAQVDGLVSGLSGGATYERLQGQNGLGRKYWDSYSIGLLVAEILIVIGGVVNFLAALQVRQKASKDEA
jgi:hypothetical protein